MNVAIFCSDFSLVNLFTSRHYEELASNGVFVKLVVYDQNISKRKNFLSHAVKIAARQAKISGCSVTTAFLRKAVWKLFFECRTEKEGEFKGPPQVAIKPAGSLNTAEVFQIVKEYNCDIICLMGTRILTERAIKYLGIPIINIHSSDPREIRGGPPVFWEVYRHSRETVLTIHEVVPEVDAGGILLQERCPIHYGNTLGKTMHNTILKSRDIVVKMFRDALLSFKNGTLKSQQYAPGRLYVTPGIFQMIKAQLYCRKIQTSS